MNDFETKLDEIRIRLYEETNGMEKDEIIKQVNAHARKIAHEFGINIAKKMDENDFQPINVSV